MPNHCQNFAHFEGDAEQIKKLEKALARETANHYKKEYTDIKYLHPYLRKKESAIPDYVTNCVHLYAENYSLILSDKKDDFTQPDYDVYDLYGSRWFECEWEVMSDTEIHFIGSSAWTPALPFFQKICTTYQLNAYGDYSELGNDFAGEFTITKEGELADTQTTYQQYEANNNPDSFFEDVLYLISNGDFESFELVLLHFKNVSWRLTEGEVELLKKEYHDYLMFLTNK